MNRRRFRSCLPVNKRGIASSRGVASGDAAGGPVLAVEAVLQVQLGLADQVVGAHQVPVVDGHGEGGVHGERGLDVKGPAGRGSERYKNDVFQVRQILSILSKKRIELLGDVVLLILHFILSKLDDDVRIGFAVDVRWVEIGCLSPQSYFILITPARFKP